MYICIYMQITAINKQIGHDFKGEGQWNMGGFGGRKGTIQQFIIITKQKIKKKSYTLTNAERKN